MSIAIGKYLCTSNGASRSLVDCRGNFRTLATKSRYVLLFCFVFTVGIVQATVWTLQQFENRVFRTHQCALCTRFKWLASLSQIMPWQLVHSRQECGTLSTLEGLSFHLRQPSRHHPVAYNWRSWDPSSFIVYIALHWTASSHRIWCWTTALWSLSNHRRNLRAPTAIMSRKVLVGFGVDVDAVAGWYVVSIRA